MNSEVRFVTQIILEKYKWCQKINNLDITSKWKKEFTDAGIHVENFNQAILFLKEYAISNYPTKPNHLGSSDGIDYSDPAYNASDISTYKCECRDKCDHEKQEKCTWHTGCDYYNLECGHDCDCPEPKRDLFDYIIYDDVLNHQLKDKLKQLILKYARNSPVDWHPGSNNKVRDIVHPSMYPYVRGITKVTKNNHVLDILNDTSIKYQWLPTDMNNINGQFQFSSFINNLPSSETELIDAITEVFNKFIPEFSKVISDDLTKRKTLQVIVKIGSIELSKPDCYKKELPFSSNVYDGGQYHKEGMSHEHIVATAVHYTHIQNIINSKLSFVKPYPNFHGDFYYPQNCMNYIKRHYDVDSVNYEYPYKSNVIINKQLGSIDCKEGFTVIFPNTLIHKVEKCTLDPKENKGSRIILAFFLIDPDKRIISTSDIDKQQDALSLDADLHREMLMRERGFTGTRITDPEIEESFSFTLCEH